MSEQQQQDVNSEHHVYINATIDKEAVHASKVHKVRRHHKRHKKYPSPHAVPEPQQLEDANTDDILSKEPMRDDALLEGHGEKVLPDTPLPREVQEPTHRDVHITGENRTAKETQMPSSRAEAETLVGTVLPPSIEKKIGASPTHETDAALHAVSLSPAIKEPIVPITPPIIEDVAVKSLTQKPHRPARRTQLVYALLLLLLVSSVLLCQDLTATHLYINIIDAKSGSIHVQQDLGAYRDAIHLTTPLVAQSNSSVLLGVYIGGTGGTQQLLTLKNNASTLALQRSTSLANGAITTASDGRLLAESANGLQVATQDGQVLWQVQGQQPTRGVHHFQPVSDAQAVYTVKSITHSQIAAYDLANGHARWVQALNDTLEYAPPFLLDNGILYVASDHNIFAFTSNDGILLWEKPYASRTLLLENEGQNHLLIALSSAGIQALRSDTGEIAWSFRGNPDSDTLPTQFYQGSIGNIQGANGNSIYATGVVWQIPQVRESVWLYAVDAATGTMRWSRQLASGLTGVDVGRGLQPLLDTHNGLVVVQHTASGAEQAVTAYDANTGKQVWNTPLKESNASSPRALQVSQDTLALFTTTTNSNTILWTPSLYRACILFLLLVSVVGLLLFLPEKQKRIQSIALSVTTQFKVRRRYAYTLTVLALLFVCISVSIFAYTRFEQPTRQRLMTDEQGSVVVTDTGNDMHQLEALGPNGTQKWRLFSSEGVFSLPNTHVQAGTILVALHGHIARRYLVAEDDPAYSRPLDSTLTLYLLNRTTGHALWQQVVSYPDEQQDTEVIGADATYIYIAGEHLVPLSTRPTTQSIQTTQLFAVNERTGTVDWRIFGPTQSNSKQHIHSTLLLKNGQAFWRVANTIFTIDISVGQIIAREGA